MIKFEPVLEITNFRAFGSEIATLGEKAYGKLENKYKYNGIEFDNDLDLNTYEANLRDLDPQTGRWWQIDPKVDEMYQWSTYASLMSLLPLLVFQQ